MEILAGMGESTSPSGFHDGLPKACQRTVRPSANWQRQLRQIHIIDAPKVSLLGEVELPKGMRLSTRFVSSRSWRLETGV
jgi:hypothetical protein